ncbi:MAG: MlaE family lipid ABC transporter permease subunit [Alphaproteobacteria bacterium]|nr:MlaE family lipid ABC transporter permease subunit [Alphaproteobacteria bacterium]
MAPPSRVGRAVIDLAGLDTLDTAGACLVTRLEGRLRGAGLEVERRGLDDHRAGLLDAVAEAETDEPMGPPPPSAPIRFLVHLGQSTEAVYRDGASLLGFFGLLVVKTGRAAAQPRRLRGTAIASHVEQAGVNAMPIVGLLSFLIGVVLAYQGADQLARFGAEIFTVNLVGIAVLREMGGLITAIIVAGRSGSAFTAQIGTMKVNQEIDALQTLGLDPIDLLVLPRVVALLIALPMLTFFANILGLMGGGLMAWAALGIAPATFVDQLQMAVGVEQLWIGMVKAPVFAFTIAMVGCYQGLKVSGSAESVGRMTTQAVVQSIFLVIVIDAAFSILFSSMGI